MKKKIKQFRFGPDLPSTHWILYFKGLKKRYIYKKFGKHGKNLDVRPFSSVIAANNVYLGDNITIRPFTIINAENSRIIIESDVLIAPNVYISVTNHNYIDQTKPIREQGHTFKEITIKRGAWIGFGAIILQGVTIGENAVIAAGAVVTKDVPQGEVFGGIPAQRINVMTKTNDISESETI